MAKKHAIRAKKDQAGSLPKGVFSIDGQLYDARCLKVGARVGDPNEWDQFLDDVGEDDRLVHWKDAYFWGQDATAPESSRAIRGFQKADALASTTASSRHADVGFRPVLVPLYQGTTASPCCGKKDGDLIHMGCLTLSGFAVSSAKAKQGGIEYGELLPIGFTDSARKEEDCLDWVYWKGILVCAHTILTNVSWDELNGCGLVFASRANSTEFTTPFLIHGERIIIPWTPLSASFDKDFTPAFLVSTRNQGRVESYSIFKYVGPDSKLSGKLFKPADGQPWEEERTANTKADAKAMAAGMSQDFVLCDTGAVLEHCCEPCYYLHSNTSRISIVNYSPETYPSPCEFRADELAAAKQAAAELTAGEAQATAGEITVLDYSALRMPSYQNRVALTIESLVNQFFRLEIQCVGEDEFPFDEDALDIAKRQMMKAVFADPVLARQSYIDKNRRTEKIGRKLIYQMAANFLKKEESVNANNPV